MTETCGIVLAGGAGTRLYPMTSVVSKQLQPVYDKPMIYYPLSTLMMAGIRDILLITTPHDVEHFRRLLGDGSRLGIRLTYAIQDRPRGIADAFVIGRDFIAGRRVCLILGDNLFYGKLDFLRQALATDAPATIFGYRVQDPHRYGVVEIDADGRILSLEEKPPHPRSNLAIPGLYVYAPDVCDIAATLQPSSRGEVEITDVHKVYLERGQLHMVQLGRGIAWLDTGTPESLLDASTFIHAIEKRQGMKIACLEEVAWRQGFIGTDAFRDLIESLPKSDYRQYCSALLDHP
jgi:glucose-1-phosphate thymidylyltransferase